MSTPYRAREVAGGASHTCEGCDWCGQFGAEDHTERTGHRTRAERWIFFERHCVVEACPPSGETMRRPVGIRGRALFFERTDYENGADFFEIVDQPEWRDLCDVATRMMITTEDTHHCFFEDFYRVERAEAIEARRLAEQAGLEAAGLPVYRFSMGS